jgi:diguanylate cyclase (GGDEF)-like protein
MLGYTPAELLALSVKNIVPDFTDDLWADHWRQLRQIQSLQLEGWHRKKNGEAIPVEIHADYMQFQGTEYACGLVRDITDRQQLQEALREQAIRDPLTGLFNRRYLDETLLRELHRCQRNNEPLAVAMLDLDHFKHFNDAYGHDAGDSVLRAIGELLLGSLRGGDIACRYGGEELTVILPGSALDDARMRFEELRQAVTQLDLHYRDGELLAITVSIGLAAAEPEEMDAAALLSRADAALYQAKEQGRNRVVANMDQSG